MRLQTALYACFLASCLSCAQSISLGSTPSEAEVSIGGKVIGRTPLNIDVKQLNSDTANTGRLIALKKSGYRELIVAIPKDYDHLETNVILQPESASQAAGSKARPTLTPPEIIQRNRQIDSDLSKILQQQLEIFQRKPTDLAALKTFQNQYPSLASLYFLEALVAYQQGDAAAANKAAGEALRRAPGEIDYTLLIDTITAIEPKR